MKITSNKLPSTVVCPTSKSYAARALIIAALKNSKVTLSNLPSAKDTKELISVLKCLGLEIKVNDLELNVQNSFPDCEKDSSSIKEIYCGEGGTTIRFILPLIALGKNSYKLIFAGRMNERPMDDIYLALTELGVKVEKHEDGVFIQGPIQMDKTASIDANKSSQFASAFEHLKLVGFNNYKVINLNHSILYYEMSKKLVKHFEEENFFEIPPDFSSLPYFLVYSVLNQDLKISNVKSKDYLQADNKIFEVLDEIGANYHIGNEGLSIFKIKEFKRGFSIDASTCIDLVSALVFLAAHISKESEIYNIEKLKYKECDRLSEILKQLTFFGVKYSYNSLKDLLIISGNTKEKALSTLYQSEDDHRMVILASLFLKQNGGGEVKPSKSVDKSFPQFFSYFA